MPALVRLKHVLYAADAHLCVRLCGAARPRALDEVMAAASALGNGPLYVVVGLGLALGDPVGGAAFLTTALAAFTVTVTVFVACKRRVRRRRPGAVLPRLPQRAAPPDAFSFPSGHAASAFTMAALLAAFYPAAGLFAYGVAGLVAVSRVYNGVHYPSDAVAGALLGIGAAKGAIALLLPWSGL